MKFNFITVLIPILLLNAGCSTFLSQSDSAKRYSLKEINTVIDQYETDGHAPKGYPSIKDYYVYRSYCHAHHSPKYMVTRFGYDLTELGIANLHPVYTVVGVVCIPVGIVYDTVAYPVQFVRTKNIPQSEINTALRDLESARSLGYEHDIFAPQIAGPAITHLDKLGFEHAKGAKGSGL